MPIRSAAPLRLRPAAADDALDLFAWRNDPVSRAMFRDGGTATLDGHLDWYRRSLTADGRQMVIGELADGAKVGVVRFDLGDDGRWEVSINTNPQLRGCGLGAALLAEAVAAFAGARPGCALIAEVKPENQASRRAFEKAGFALVGEAGGYLHYERD